MVAYALYPAWETPRLRNRLAEWLVADGRYAATVVDRYADPAHRDLEEVRDALIATREARVAWQEALATAQHEPVRHRGISRAAATDAQHALAQLGRSAMVLEAHLPARSADPRARRRPAWPRRCAGPPRRARRRYGSGGCRTGSRCVDAVAHWDVPTPTEDGTTPVGDPVVRPGRRAAAGRAGGVHPGPGRARRLDPGEQHPRGELSERPRSREAEKPRNREAGPQDADGTSGSSGSDGRSEGSDGRSVGSLPDRPWRGCP